MSATILLKSIDIRIPGYKILRPLGEGGMASVFLAVQESLDREVALKVMAPALSANAEFTERFLKEGRITAKLNHPNLVTVFDIGSHGTVYYLAAEYIPGGTLREKMNAGQITVAETLDIVCDVARGLHFAHAKGFVHRDVKPGNILFKADGTAVLADFGIAKAMDSKSSVTVAGASIGTPDYMSPEQARAEPVDGRSDIYSMGVMFFEMLNGDPPYQASDPFTVALMHVTQPVPNLPPEHSWLQPLLDGLMAKVADNRFPNGEAFIAAVEQLLAAAPEASTIQQQRSAKKRAGGPRLSGSTTSTAGVRERAAARKWILAGSALSLALVGSIGFWFWSRSEGDLPVPATRFVPPTVPITTDKLPPEVKIPSPVDSPESTVPLLLAQADAYKDYALNSTTDPGRKLTYPPDDNAVDLYRKVLNLEPTNAKAKAGLSAVAAYFLKGAQTSCNRSIWTGCRVLSEEGLKADPEHAELKALKEKAEQALLGG